MSIKISPRPREITISSEGIAPVVVRNYFLEHRLGREIGGTKYPNLLFLGPAGVGKTEGVKKAGESICDLMGYHLIRYNEDMSQLSPQGQDRFLKEIVRNNEKPFIVVDCNLSSHDQSDLSGVPKMVARNFSVIVDGKEEEEETTTTEFIPPSWVRLLTIYPGIVFFDEVTNLNPGLETLLLKITDEKIVGYTKLHPEVMVVLAGNRAEDSELSQELARPTLNRVQVFEVNPPSREAWTRYIDRKYGDLPCYDPLPVGYLADLVDGLKRLDAETSNDGDYASTSPRTCETVFRQLLKLKIGVDEGLIKKENWEEALAQVAYTSLGAKHASEFVAFYLNSKVINEILENPAIIENNPEYQMPQYLCSIGYSVGKMAKGAIIREMQGEKNLQDQAFKKQFPILIEALIKRGSSEYLSFVLTGTGIFDSDDIGIERKINKEEYDGFKTDLARLTIMQSWFRKEKISSQQISDWVNMADEHFLLFSSEHLRLEEEKITVPSLPGFSEPGKEYLNPFFVNKTKKRIVDKFTKSALNFLDGEFIEKVVDFLDSKNGGNFKVLASSVQDIVIKQQRAKKTSSTDLSEETDV